MDYPGFDFYPVLVNSILLLLLFVSLSLKKKSLAFDIVKKPPIFRLGAAIFGILILSVFSSYFGQTHGGKTIDGTISNTIVVNIQTKGSIEQATKDKTLFLVMHRNGNYYLVEKENPAPKHPKVYIIPDNQVEWVEQQRIR